MNTRKYIYPILIILISIGFYYFEKKIDQHDNTSDNDNVTPEESNFYYLPTSTTGSIIIHQYYSLSYSEKHEQAEWVAYELKKEHIAKNNFKRPYFEEDHKVKSSSADWRNYKKSGYNKGHLCPAADRTFSKKAFEETFLTSNISPQEYNFNSGIWNSLEQKVRTWAKTYNKIYVVTGGILTDDLSTIGYEHVSVPQYFYKIVFDNSPKQPKMIAFLIPHEDVDQKLSSFVVSVDHIEKLTQIDFFSKLEDSLEKNLEATASTKGWSF
ncbi:DNA/RNA non-specific endonuclease [Aquimarina algicola]|uniref:DNA/RNA non-specific endonuclease n=1 Tax=Aquimarina algicola TaxID=2589995 RepID=A0A504J6J6_9FLAO|nr:DNA/RNA non-specific endonuclease [Aquimarina algicola]TPN86144.1 DNA/RNA non-specific endonuclease [Aquimarina algicola]